jgi:hypothetical protein
MSDIKLPNIDPGQYVAGPSWRNPQGDPPWILAHLKPEQIREMAREYALYQAKAAAAEADFRNKIANQFK